MKWIVHPMLTYLVGVSGAQVCNWSPMLPSLQSFTNADELALATPFD